MRRLMLVDDEVVIAMQLEEFLASMGYEVVGMAFSGKEAIELSRDLIPDLILMDIVMPGELDGIAGANNQEKQDIPVIFITAHADKDLIERAKSLEPLGYILKPFQEIQLTATIEIAFYNNDMAKRLRESENLYRTLVETIPHGIQETDISGNITFANSAFHKILGYERGELTGKSVYDLFSPYSYREKLRNYHETLIKKQPVPTSWIGQYISKDGRYIDAQNDWDYKRDRLGRITGFTGVVTDISERKRADEALKAAHDELEQRVEERTAELLKANELLTREIQERKRTKDELEIKTTTLEEVNTALRVLLKKRDEDKTEIEEKMLLNIKELVLPYLNKLKESGLEENQNVYTSVLESNLSDIISPFSHRLSSRFLNLTPTEIRIANLIQQGKTTKEIAFLLDVSPKTIESHRKNIRGKLGLRLKKENLRSHLMSFQ